MTWWHVRCMCAALSAQIYLFKKYYTHPSSLEIEWWAPKLYCAESHIRSRNKHETRCWYKTGPPTTTLFQISNELVYSWNSYQWNVIQAGNLIRGGHNQAYRQSDSTPPWDKLIIGIELSLIVIIFHQLPWKNSDIIQKPVGWLSQPVSIPIQPDTPIGGAAGITKSKQINFQYWINVSSLLGHSIELEAMPNSARILFKSSFSLFLTPRALS